MKMKNFKIYSLRTFKNLTGTVKSKIVNKRKIKILKIVF